jgi:hypothetical protein
LDGCKLRGIIEEKSWERAVEEVGGFKQVDLILEPCICGFANKPDAFPVVPNSNSIRLAKMKARRYGEINLPAFSLWFKIGEDDENINFLWLESKS